MSTLRIDNFTPSAGGTSFGIEGIAKAGLNFNHTTPAVRSSDNVASVTDNAAGDLTVNFTNNFADANFRFVFNAGGEATAGSTGFAYGSWVVGTNAAVPTTSSQRLQVGYAANSTLYDVEFNNSAVFGDLA